MNRHTHTRTLPLVPKVRTTLDRPVQVPLSALRKVLDAYEALTRGIGTDDPRTAHWEALSLRLIAGMDGTAERAA